jgi:hypothetical protein
MEDLQWGEPVNGWRLSLSLDKEIFTVEEPILATIVFQNVSTREQALGGHGRDFDYTLDCKTDYGEKVPFTLFGKKMLVNREIAKTTGGILQPKEQIVVEVSISHHLDLSLPGKYRLSVSRQALLDQPGEPFILSNTVEFKIEEW